MNRKLGWPRIAPTFNPRLAKATPQPSAASCSIPTKYVQSSPSLNENDPAISSADEPVSVHAARRRRPPRDLELHSPGQSRSGGPGRASNLPGVRSSFQLSTRRSCEERSDHLACPFLGCASVFQVPDRLRPRKEASPNYPNPTRSPRPPVCSDVDVPGSGIRSPAPRKFGLSRPRTCVLIKKRRGPWGAVSVLQPQPSASSSFSGI